MNEDLPPESPEERKKQLELEIKNARVLLQKANKTLVEVNAKSEAISTIDSEASTIRLNLSTIDSEASTIRSNLSTIDSEASTIRLNLSTIDSEASTIRLNLSTIDSEASTIRSNLSTIDSEASTIRLNLSTIDSEASTIRSELAEKNATITSTIESINNSTASAQSNLTESQEISASLKQDQADAEKTKSEIDAFHGEIKELYNLLLTDTKGEEGQDVDTQDEEGQGAKLSIKSQILTTQKQIEEINSQAESDFSELKDTLETDIRSLLPEAGSAGLSSAYFEAKARYGPIPYEEKVHGSGRKARFGHFLKNLWRGGSMNYIAFIAPLLFLTYHYVGFIRDSTADEITLSAILLRFLLATPLAAISLFGWSSIKLQRMLYEEYNHKQRVMQLYVSFTDKIEEADANEQKEKLIAIMLKTVADKPTPAMTEEDKFSINALYERFSGKGTSDNTKKNESSS